MARISNRYAYLDHAVVPVGLTAFLAQVGRGKDVSFQYQMHQSVGSTTILVYGTLEQSDSRLRNPVTGAVIPPITLPDIWYELPTQFSPNLITTIGTEILPVAADPHGFVAVQLLTTVELPEFSLIINSKSE